MTVTTAFVVGMLIGLCLAEPPRRPPSRWSWSPAARAVIEAARELVRNRRWYLGLSVDRELPDTLQAALDRAVRALDAAEADRGRG